MLHLLVHAADVVGKGLHALGERLGLGSDLPTTTVDSLRP